MKHAREDYDRIQDPAGLIPDDEPVFLVRAQDRVAPLVIEAWAHEASKLGVDPQMIEMARAHADRMRQWQHEHGLKLPDLLPPSSIAKAPGL